MIYRAALVAASFLVVIAAPRLAQTWAWGRLAGAGIAVLLVLAFIIDTWPADEVPPAMMMHDTTEAITEAADRTGALVPDPEAFAMALAEAFAEQDHGRR